MAELQEDPSARLLRCLHKAAVFDNHRERLELAGRMDPLHQDLWGATQKSKVAFGRELLHTLLDLRTQEFALQKLCVQQRRAIMASVPKYDEHQMLEEEEGRLYRLCTAHCNLAESYCELEYWPQAMSHAQQALEFAEKGEQLGFGWAPHCTRQTLHRQMLAFAYLRSIFYSLWKAGNDEGVSLRLLRKETMRQMKESPQVQEALRHLSLHKKAPWEAIARAINPTRLKGTGRTLSSWMHFVQVLRLLPAFQEHLSRMAIRLPQPALVASFRVFMQVFQHVRAADGASTPATTAGFVPWKALADAINADVALVEELQLRTAAGGQAREEELKSVLGVAEGAREEAEAAEGVEEAGADGAGVCAKVVRDLVLPPPVDLEGGTVCWEGLMVCVYSRAQRLGKQRGMLDGSPAVGLTTLVHEQLEQLSAALRRMTGYDLRAGLLRLVAPALCACAREFRAANRAEEIQIAKKRATTSGGGGFQQKGQKQGEPIHGGARRRRRWWESLLVQPDARCDSLSGLQQLASLAQTELVQKLETEWPEVRAATDPPVEGGDGEDGEAGEAGEAGGPAVYVIDPGALSSVQCFERCMAPACFSVYGRYCQRQRQRQRALGGARGYAVDLNPEPDAMFGGEHPRTRFNSGTGWNFSGVRQQLLQQQQSESELLQQRHSRGVMRMKNVVVNEKHVDNLADGSIENNQLKDARAEAMEAAHRYELQVSGIQV
jgi:hypothetical protein